MNDMLYDNEKTLPLLNEQPSPEDKSHEQLRKPATTNASALNRVSNNDKSNHPDFFDELHNANYE